MRDRDWEIDDPATQIGRHLNETRRRLQFARNEVNRLVELAVNLGSLQPAVMNEAAEIESDFETTRNMMYRLPELVARAAVLAGDDNITMDERDEWLSDSFEVINSFITAANLERRVRLFSEAVPLALHMCLRQDDDQHISRHLRVVVVLVEEMLRRFGLEENVFTVAGTKFSLIHLRGVAVDSSLLMLPLSNYSHMLGWAPIGHEVGHVVYRSRSINRSTLDTKLYSIMDQYVGLFDIHRRVQLLRWFEEVFADAIMTELFTYGAVFHLDSMLSFERSMDIITTGLEILTEIETTDDVLGFSSHPPRLLRLKMMLDILEKRTEDANCDPLRRHFHLDEVDFNVDTPWDDETFLSTIVDLIAEVIDETGSAIDLERFAEILIDIRDEDDLSAYSVLDIVTALIYYYAQQHYPVLGEIGLRPERIMEYLMERVNLET